MYTLAIPLVSCRAVKVREFEILFLARRTRLGNILLIQALNTVERSIAK